MNKKDFLLNEKQVAKYVKKKLSLATEPDWVEVEDALESQLDHVFNELIKRGDVYIKYDRDTGFNASYISSDSGNLKFIPLSEVVG